jgi:hypothetical protein
MTNNAAIGADGLDGVWCFEDFEEGTPGFAGLGGGIYVAGGAVSINNSTLSTNQAVGGNGGNFFHCWFWWGSYDGGAGSGGGIYVSGGRVTVFQNTLSANQSRGGFGYNGGNGSGGGLSIFGSNVEVQHSTFATNQSIGGAAVNGGLRGQGSGGGLVFAAGTLRTRNTILARNAASTTAPDVSGTFGSLGHNLIGDSTGGSGFDPTDSLNVDPLLGALQDNGGPTFTHALRFGSPAIDGGDNADAPEFDQRGPGFQRIVNGIIDIGAFEVQATELPVRGLPLSNNKKPVLDWAGPIRKSFSACQDDLAVAVNLVPNASTMSEQFYLIGSNPAAQIGSRCR